MSETPDNDWTPSHELLTAYADGELDADAEASGMRSRIEAWLAAHPTARVELEAVRRLKVLWERTRPASPSAETWREVLGRVEQMQTTVPARKVSFGNWAVAGVAAAACIVWAILLVGSFREPPETPEVFAVATDSDIEIVHIDGAMLDCIAIGTLPLRGVLDLADPGDVTSVNLTPDRRDNMVPMVPSQASRRPMIWAKLEGEGE
jgi:hypothetical protein